MTFKRFLDTVKDKINVIVSEKVIEGKVYRKWTYKHGTRLAWRGPQGRVLSSSKVEELGLV